MLEVAKAIPGPALRISSDVCPTEIGLTEKLPVIPDGKPEIESVTDCAKPLIGVTDIVPAAC